VLNEEVEKASLVGFDFREFLENVVCYEVGAAAARGEGKGFLEPVCKRLAPRVLLEWIVAVFVVVLGKEALTKTLWVVRCRCLDLCTGCFGGEEG
jgi:hypothetical protein